MTRLKYFKQHIPTAPLTRASLAPLGRDADAQDRKRFYDSVVWERPRAAKLRRDPLCQCCAHDQVVTPATHVDHWEPLAQGGHPTADENLVSLCTPCHSRKTMCERNGTPYPQIVPSRPRSIVIA